MPLVLPISDAVPTTARVSERTYQTLLDKVITREIAPGEVLEERRLAEVMQVSRTPMRAALNRLLGEGMLTRLSNGSIMVRVFGATELLELLHVRRLLESDAAAMATGRIPTDKLTAMRKRFESLIQKSDVATDDDWTLDNEVHALIAEHCGNKSMATIIADARLRVRMCNVERMPGRAVLARQEHLAIVIALHQGDAAQAREAMAIHLENVRSAYLQSMGFAYHVA